jgi:hypothetical protein
MTQKNPSSHIHAMKGLLFLGEVALKKIQYGDLITDFLVLRNVHEIT